MRQAGFEPALLAWEARVMPLDHWRDTFINPLAEFIKVVKTKN